MTLLELLQEVQVRCLETPATSYVNNVNPAISRFVSYANRAVLDILEAHDWSALKEKHTVTIIDDTDLYPLPSDFGRLIPDTTYKGSTYWPVDFPATDQFIAYAENYNIGQVYHGRLYQGQLQFINVPAGDLSFTYIKKGVITGTNTEKFTTDDDTFGLDDELLIRCIKAVYDRQTGDENAGNSLADYISRLDRMKVRDTGARSVNDLIERDRSLPLWRHSPDYDL